VDFIERHKHEPFFLYLSHYAVHTRLDGKPELVRKYEAKPGGGKGPGARRNNPHLAAQLETIDEGVGMVMRKLQALGLADDTVLVFTGDNGGESRVTSNAPLRAGKSTLYEGGIREPLRHRLPDAHRKRRFLPHVLRGGGGAAGPGPAGRRRLDPAAAEGPVRPPPARHVLLALPAGPAALPGRKVDRCDPAGQLETHRVLRYRRRGTLQPEALVAWRKRVGADIPPDCRDYDPKKKRR